MTIANQQHNLNNFEEETELLELLTVIVFMWIAVKTIGLTWKLTWGVAKVVASILIGLAFPVLIICLLFIGGMALLLPLAVIGIAFGILKVYV
jgi:hypothetical protein